MSGGVSVTLAAYEVGYASPTQFSREYARTFELPPGRDSERLLARYAA
jgi:AraC-like DNA-binding protein